MSLIADRVLPAAARGETLRRILLAFLLVAASLLVMALFERLLPRFYWSPNSLRVWVPFAGAVLAALLFSGVTFARFERLLAVTMRGSALGILVYLVAERPDFTLANAETASAAASYVATGYWLALACGLAGVVRPAFAAPASLYIISTRLLVQSISGLPMSTLDVRYLVDMTLYLTTFGLLVAVLAPRFGGLLAAPERQDEVVGAAFGLHLANYFWSGIAKAVAGPTPWYWVLNNKTFNQIPYTIETGIQPLAHWPWLMDIAYRSFEVVCVPLNAAVVLIQLFAVVCVLRTRWLIVATLCYDALHIGIFILGGLFFWPWIWNNMTIYVAVRRRVHGLSLNTKAAAIATILLGAPGLHLVEAAWLGWFDVTAGRSVYFEAITKEGRTIRVPSAFFLSHSYSVSHGYMAFFPHPRHYEATMLASTYSLERSQWSETCPAPETVPGTGEEPEAARRERQAELERFLRAHHQKMLEREQTLGALNYYFRLHHHPSNLFLYPEFNQLPLRDVVAYNLALESGCFGIAEGRLTKTVWAKDTERYDVR